MSIVNISEELEVVEFNGVRLVIDPAIMSEHMQWVVRQGHLSQPEADRIGGIVEDGERFLELGGGIGYTSSIVAMQKKAASITTFEANPRLIPAMKRTHAMNGVEATIVNGIVSPRKTAKTVPFYVHRSFHASSLVNPGEEHTLEIIPVAVMSLEEVMRSFAPTMLMIDIEGAELDLLKGVNLAGVNKVYLELHLDVIGPVGIHSLFEIFHKQNFYYDPHPSTGNVVLFRRMHAHDARHVTLWRKSKPRRMFRRMRKKLIEVVGKRRTANPRPQDEKSLSPDATGQSTL